MATTKENFTTISVRVEKKIRNELAKFAKSQGLSLASLCRMTMLNELKKMKVKEAA